MNGEIFVNVVESSPLEKGVPYLVTLSYREPETNSTPEAGPTFFFIRNKGRIIPTRRVGPPVPDEVFERIRQKAAEALQLN